MEEEEEKERYQLEEGTRRLEPLILTIIVQKLLDEVNVCEHHSATAVSL